MKAKPFDLKPTLGIKIVLSALCVVVGSYRQMPTVEAYVLVEQERMATTIQHGIEPGWQSDVIEGPGSILKLPGIGVEIPLERIYERITVAGARASGG